ncbi:MAG: dihydropyrimidinase [Deltaproteobacteria bacterium]|nr:dihydropyrimidinase [Deltaproteobacteria bacterium]MBI3295744.1 dihydropyrimidinase [Deltaproteobacteria bacterium]
MKKTLIKNGTVVTATDTAAADILIEGEKIAAIGRDLFHSPDTTVDATGCYVIPGGIDAHTHLDLPFMGTSSSDDFETGTRAALFGGTTSIIDFAFQTQGRSLKEGLATWREKAAGRAIADYGFHIAVTDFNPTVHQEVRDLIEKDGVTSFKTFMAYKGALMIDDKQMIGLMNEVKKWGGLVTVHAENGDLADSLIQQNCEAKNLAPKFHALSRPEIVESEATGRAIDIAYAGGHPLYVVHMTCEGALNRVREATKRNQTVLVETCVQYLLLDDSVYERPGFEGSKWVMSPPIRKPKDQTALWNGIDQGLVHTVATDHCPFCLDQKAMGKDDFSKIPNGAPGIEHRMELMHSEGVVKNRITLNRFVDLNCTAPAKIFGLYPKKGSLSVGSDADIVIFDPKVQHTISQSTHHMRCDYSAYEGWKVQGKVRTVYLRGTCAIDKGQVLIGKGFGQYLPRKKFKE